MSEATIGIDLGGTSTRIGLFDGHMHMRGSRKMPTPVAEGPSAAVRSMAEAIESLLTETSQKRVSGIGIGSPGPIDLRKGILGKLPNLPGWDGFALRDELATATRRPVILESDANAAAVAEWRMGAAHTLRVDSMAMITLGTGVGSGLILNGRVWQGMFGMAGEIGHATVEPGGELCNCGSRGCLELYASAGAIVRSVQGNMGGEASLAPHEAASLTAEAVARMAVAGNSSALNAYRDMGRRLGIGVANLISLLDLPLVVVGGGVAEAWPLFSPSMFQAMRQYSVVYRLLEPRDNSSYELDRTSVVRASLGPAAGLIGAALLPRLALGLQGEEAKRLSEQDVRRQGVAEPLAVAASVISTSI